MPIPQIEHARRLRAYHAHPTATAAAQSLSLRVDTFHLWMMKTGLPSKRPRGSLRGPTQGERLAAYAATSSDAQAARLLGIPASTFQEWRWRQRLPEKYTGRLLLHDPAEEGRRVAYMTTATDGEAARKLGLPRVTFSSWRAARGLPAKRPKLLTDEEARRRAWAYQESDDDAHAAKLLGIPLSTYSRWRKSTGRRAKRPRGGKARGWPTHAQAASRKDREGAYAKRHRELARRSRRRLRLEVFTAYGGERCAFCEEADPRVLSIDHIAGDGGKRRREQGTGTRFYRWLKRNDFPAGYQVLCANCQSIKRIANNEQLDSGVRPLAARGRRARHYRTRVKLATFTHYSRGPPRCACCGFNDIRALEIDHVHGGGQAHRKLVGNGRRLYLWLRNRNYPDGFQVLCANDNVRKAYVNGEFRRPLDGKWWFETSHAPGGAS